MVKVNLGGCDSFVKDADYKVYVGKALEALEVLESGTGEGNDFIGWKHLPSETPEALIAECEAVRGHADRADGRRAHRGDPAAGAAADGLRPG